MCLKFGFIVKRMVKGEISRALVEQLVDALGASGFSTDPSYTPF
ncbi:hypothetical protein [Shewanella inventionis]|uniref:Uncharacterized protein n=1 Tax=Shewanella inventionis TaxID=1738770 RepID=A0ABQ1JE53_9GAMM|nr:hypothetical protein [Shewanella inventionis]GGB64193.1 hypothetical protein GCM10011607_26210 [Shewanella inventionis]